MAQPVYSSSFFAGATEDGTLDAYTVPAGFIAIIRFVTIFNFSGSTVTVDIDFAGSGSRTGVILYQEVPSGAPSVDWDGRLVLAPGDVVRITNSTASTVVSISGYLLSTP